MSKIEPALCVGDTIVKVGDVIKLRSNVADEQASTYYSEAAELSGKVVELKQDSFVLDCSKEFHSDIRNVLFNMIERLEVVPA